MLSIHMIELRLYGVMILLSILIGMGYIYLSLKEEIKKNKLILLYYLLYVVCAFLFGKYYTMITTGEFDIIKAGLSSYGGLLGVVFSSYVFERIIPLNNKLIKSSIISLPLVYGISKLACFFAGCCDGIPYTGLFNIVYPFQRNINQFPIQIVETISFILLFIIVNKMRNNKYISYITFILALVLKFSLDFFRYDHITIILSKNQIFSIVLFVVTLFLFIRKLIYEKKTITKIERHT